MYLGFEKIPLILLNQRLGLSIKFYFYFHLQIVLTIVAYWLCSNQKQQSDLGVLTHSYYLRLVAVIFHTEELSQWVVSCQTHDTFHCYLKSQIDDHLNDEGILG